MSDNPYRSEVDVPTPPAAPRRRWWLAALIVAIGAALIVGIRVNPAFPGEAERSLATIAASALIAFLLFGWLVFFAGLRWRTRLALLAAAAVSLVGLGAALRVDGFSGDIVPHLAWRWSRKPDEQLEQPTSFSRGPATGASTNKAIDRTVDLVTTTKDDFPQFLGPDRNGQIAGPRLARDWQTRPPKPVWRQPIGAGWSAFAVVGPHAVTQEQRGDLELVVGYEVATGRPCWSHADKGRFGSLLDGIGPRATPTIAEGRVYTMGATGKLNCLDGATGEVVWSHDVLAEHRAGNVQWGKSCSPAVIGELVVVSAGGPNGHSLVAYDKRGGELVWSGGDAPSSYSSPVLTTLAGVPQILIVNHHSLAAHDPLDGHVLWRFRWEGGQPKVPQPVAIAPDRVLIGAGYGIGCTMLRVVAGIGPRSESDDGDDAWQANEVWKSAKLKPKFTNLIIRDGFVYGLDDGRTLVCLDLADGRLQWKGGRYGHGQLLLVDDLLLIQAESGEVALVAATPERHDELTRFQAIEGKTWNNPVLSGRHLLVRNAEEAACYELPLISE